MRILFALFAIVCLAACGTPAPAAVTADYDVMTPISTASPVAATQSLTPTPAAEPGPGIGYLKMIDPTTGWAVLDRNSKEYSRFIVRTIDGGASWEDVTPPDLVGMWEGHFWGELFALDGDTAWLISAGEHGPDADPEFFGVVWRTDDGGRTWTPSNHVVFESSASVREAIEKGTARAEAILSPQLQFVDAQHGFLKVSLDYPMGHYFDRLLRTADGGQNWDQLPLSCDDYVQCLGPVFFDVHTGLLGSQSGNGFHTLYSSIDGGRTWGEGGLPHPPEVVEALSDGSDNFAEFLYSTQSFARIDADTAGIRRSYGDRYDGDPLDSGERLAAAGVPDTYYYLTSDRGRTWRWFPVSGPVFFLDASTGWRFSTTSAGYNLECTIDGGASWQQVGVAQEWIGEPQYVDATNGWATALQEDYSTRLWRTTDGGLSWVELTTAIAIPSLENMPAN